MWPHFIAVHLELHLPAPCWSLESQLFTVLRVKHRLWEMTQIKCCLFFRVLDVSLPGTSGLCRPIILLSAVNTWHWVCSLWRRSVCQECQDHCWRPTILLFSSVWPASSSSAATSSHWAGCLDQRSVWRSLSVLTQSLTSLGDVSTMLPVVSFLCSFCMCGWTAASCRVKLQRKKMKSSWAA